MSTDDNSNRKKQLALRWELPPDDDTCQYPDVVFDSSLNFTRNGSCARLFVKDSYRTMWTEKAYARAWIEDRTLVEAISCGLARLPIEGDNYSLQNALSFKADPDFDMASTNIDMIALSYVHHSATSTYGLAKVPEPVEKALIDGVRRRAKTRGVDAVFIWSDQTIKSRVQDDVWLKVGVYAYAVLSGLVLPTKGYTTRLWPMVEFSLLESCGGFIIDSHACQLSPNNDLSAVSMIINSNNGHKILEEGDIDCFGFGNTMRDGVALMANRFLTTQLGLLETYYQKDRLLLREICVSFLKGPKGHSIGHHLLCKSQCVFRKGGGLVHLLDGIGSRVFLEGADYAQGSAMWDAVSFANPAINVFRTKSGFTETVFNAIISCAWRSLLPVEGISDLFMAIRRLACRFSFSSTGGYKGVLWVSNLSLGWEKKMMGIDSDMPYWSSPVVLAWIELESGDEGNNRWPGASVKLDQVTTAEMDTLLRLHCRFYWKPKRKAEGSRNTMTEQGKILLDMMRSYVSQLPDNDDKGTLLRQMNEMGLDDARQDPLLDEELLDIIGQEIERHGMVQQTGSLHMTDSTFEMPYSNIERVTPTPKTLCLSMEKKEDPEKRALQWIFVQDNASKAREVIGICGRLCMSAIYATVGMREFSRFLQEEKPFLVARNRPVGKRHANTDYRYVQQNRGVWQGKGDWNVDERSISWSELPVHAMVIYHD